MKFKKSKCKQPNHGTDQWTLTSICLFLRFFWVRFQIFSMMKTTESRSLFPHFTYKISYSGIEAIAWAKNTQHDEKINSKDKHLLETW